MQRFLRIGLVTILTLLFLSGLLLAGFMYKVKYGFPVSFETEAPAINFPTGRINVLLFSKTTGFRHGESIEAGKEAFRDLALKNNWFLYATEEGGVFNPQQLARFDAVIFNNSTGRVLNDEQREHLKAYVTEGGKLIGIHGAGDDSHRWDWYEQNLLGSRFSHHPLQPQLQEATVTMEAVPDSMVSAGLPSTWSHTEEWYIFLKIRGQKDLRFSTPLTAKRSSPTETCSGSQIRILAWAKTTRWHGIEPWAGAVPFILQWGTIAVPGSKLLSYKCWKTL